RLKAHTRHGIHSPFVYRFIADGLQPPLSRTLRRELPPAPEARLLYRITAFAGAAQVWVDGGDQPAMTRAATLAGAAYAGPPREGGVCDLLCIADPARAAAVLQQCRGALHEGSIVVIAGIWHSPTARQHWQDAQAGPSVRMSIDLFYLGLLLFRPEFHVRQDFTLRTY